MQAKVNNMDFSSCSQEEMDKELGKMLPKIYWCNVKSAPATFLLILPHVCRTP